MNTRLQHPERVTSYFFSQWKTLLVVTVTGILCNGGLVLSPLLEGKLTQCLLEYLQGKSTWRQMAVLAGIYLLVVALVQCLRYGKRYYVRRFANHVSRNMKQVIYNHLVHATRQELEEESVGSMMTRAISDADACAEGMRKFTTEVFDTGIALLAYLILMLSLDWRLTLCASLFPPVAFVLAQKMKTKVTACTAAYKESAGRLNGATLERISGAMTYRVFGLEENRNRDYDGYLRDYEKKAVSANLWENTMPPLYLAISMLGAVCILWLGGRNVAGQGWRLWDVADFTAFLAAFTKLSSKASKSAKLFNAVQKAQVSWKRVHPLLSEMQPSAPAVLAESGELRVDHLCFAYPNGSEILHDISFSAQPGQIVGITGPVACGKSTLGKVFLRELPYSGTIRFAGKELRDLTAPALSGTVGYLGHQPELLSATVEDNVLLGESGSPEPWLKAVCFDREVSEMPNGLQTLVGSAGIRLSGGQQARLALARTLCGGRPLLILDDPFSAVDQTTEREIMANLRALANDSVILLLSHRLNCFPEMDQVLWMEQGTVRCGTHESLLRDCPAYANLYWAQTKGGDGHEA